MIKNLILTVFIALVGLGGFFYLRSAPSAAIVTTPSETPTPRLQTSSATPRPSVAPILRIGAVTRHVAGFVGQPVRLEGYMLTDEKTYVIFSDEASGPLGVYDLPVVGAGTDGLKFNQKYILEGVFVHGGLTSRNHSEYHLELSSPPQPIQ